MKHYNYLLRCLGVAQRTQFQKRGMCSADIAWAFHSESEEELLQLTPSYVRGTPRWSALKELGVGWWLRNQTLLRTCIEKVSFCFQISIDCISFLLIKIKFVSDCKSSISDKPGSLGCCYILSCNEKEIFSLGII